MSSFVGIKKVEIEGIDTRDYPDFSDAYVTYAEHADGSPLTDSELDELNTDSSLVYELTMDYIF